MFCRSPRGSAGGDKIGGNRHGVESLWEPWCATKCSAVADAGRTRAAGGNTRRQFFAPEIGWIHFGFREKWRRNRLLTLFDGRQSARTIHFITAFAFIGFVLIHVFMVLISGVWNNLRSMITGWYTVRS